MRIFRFSPWDLLCVAVIPLHAAIVIGYALWFRSNASVWTALLYVPIAIALSVQNTGANHNHYHTPFFRAHWLNVLTSMGFSMFESPKTPYNLGHGQHHKVTGKSNHLSALDLLGLKRSPLILLVEIGDFLFGATGLKYLMMWWMLLRLPTSRIVEIAGGPKAADQTPDEPTYVVIKALQDDAALRRQTLLEMLAMVSLRVVLLVIDWRFCLFVFLPGSYLVAKARSLENFMQHWGATNEDDPKLDSVSCYGTLYNWFTFNLGYHQEHHWRPGVHWRKLERTRRELPETGRRTVPLSHYVNLPIFYPKLAAELRAQHQAAANVEKAA
jgi:fatty acid desaturase